MCVSAGLLEYDQHGLLLFEINISYKYILSGLASFYDLGFVPFQPCVQAQMFGYSLNYFQQICVFSVSPGCWMCLCIHSSHMKHFDLFGVFPVVSFELKH